MTKSNGSMVKLIVVMLLSAMAVSSCSAFSTTGSNAVSSKAAPSSGTALCMANDKDLMRWARASRTAGADDRVVDLKRPLGLVLNEDDDGNVYVETVAPKGNAARTGLVKEGDIVTMCSATFGEQMWSTRGVGLTRVLAAIRVRAGPTVSLVFESPDETQRRVKTSAKAAAAADEARKRAQDKKDQLLKELERDEKRLKKGKFLGLF
uniref:PDZ domain-containing protein n=1 Tax=Helicotheca tamesis TaxID=374047 RepID=A0A7S2N2W7_9STRA|mmetsp:Transcript_832/g.1117  ORF Transcript_832/g.1117 Transcript_832/m.1117 type:complete len:207 (+) Transcript_832:149-769(+)|eukprot:CAMPEP_0185725684 /NCGR_PEP_ID=MMETSP1171-20130828/1885_1 /TAXON_ID=374046 /ORGANISM="Helicotheca tamensis, Strain CCMP826" /LENGTH=206 /DNA_ID=CAMNT_0028393875 /DNA_START=101 /DNA_END=721 /DNA_ORIENTATION=-